MPNGLSRSLRTLSVLIAASVIAGLTSCTQQQTTPVTSNSTIVAPTSTEQAINGIVDPLTEIEDPNNDRYVSTTVTTLVHETGTGPQTYSTRVPSAVDSVRIYVACAPAAQFTVFLQKHYSGACAASFQSFADIPVTGGTTEQLVMTVPRGTRFTVLAIPSP